MKRTAILTLCFILLLTCFTACKQDAKPTTPESKTDVSTPAVVETQPKEEAQAEADVSEPAQEEEKEPVQQSDDEQEETEPVSKVESKPTSKVESKPASKPASKVESKPTSKVESKPATSQEKEDDDQDAIVDPVEPEPLSFTSSGEFANWLKNGNTFVDERNEFVAQTQANNVVTYYRPKMMTDDRYHGGFSVHQPSSSLDYTLAPCDDTKDMYVKVSVDLKQSDWMDQNLEEIKTKYDSNDGQYLYLKTSTGVEFYYDSAPNKISKTISVFWKQFGIVHMATFWKVEKELENLTDIIPLLELEQVTVKLNDDAVIK